MEREAYRRGIRHLKARIKEMGEAQHRCKKALRHPRKTKLDLEWLEREIDEIFAGDDYWRSVSRLQSHVATRRFKISAYLDVYAEVRGKPPCHKSKEDYGYRACETRRARKEFEDACGITADLSSLPWTTGSRT
jgi:hypothetical protein